MIVGPFAAATLVLALSTLASPVQMTPRAAGSKMGISYPIQEHNAQFVEPFFAAGSQISWWYDWNKSWNQQDIFSEGRPDINAEFIPMYWNGDALTNQLTLQPGFTSVFGFNEPDLGGASAQTPSQAKDNWLQMIQQIRAINPSVTLISPAMALEPEWLINWFNLLCPGGQSTKWQNCQDAPTVINVHASGSDPGMIKDKVSRFHDTFGRPIILSEFAFARWSSDGLPDQSFQPTPQQVSIWMADITGWLNSQDYVQKYSWFGMARNGKYMGGVPDGNRLIDVNGGITALGQQYIRGGV